MKWITIEQMTGDANSEHYAYCPSDYYILQENANDNVSDRLILSKFLNHTITTDDIYEDQETGWYWHGRSIYIVRSIKDISEDELVTIRNFVYAKILNTH